MATAKQTASQGTAESGDRTSPVDRHSNQLAGSVGGVLAGRYRLGALLGQGGMGEVWRAEHILTRRPVAVKLLRDALAHRPDMRRRFLREARAAAAVNHPNVVEVLDAFEVEDGTPVLVMPLLEGETLAALIARAAPLSLPAALEVLLPLVSAVGAAHARGIVHRDLKPENVFLAKEGGKVTVKVLDFGIAKLMEGNGTDNESLTGTGSLVGTPCYMAPEQGFGERDQDHRVDIWAIGVIAYESLSSCKPIEGENIAQVVRSLLTQGITPLEVVAPDLPASVNTLVMSMLSRARSDRPQTLREVYEALHSHAAQGTPLFAAGFDNDRAPIALDESALTDPQGFAFAPTLDVTPVSPVSPSAPTGASRSSTTRRFVLALVAAALALVGTLIATRAKDSHQEPGALRVPSSPVAASVALAANLPASSAQPAASVAAPDASGARRASGFQAPRRAVAVAPAPASVTATPSSLWTPAAVSVAPVESSKARPAAAVSSSDFHGGLQEEPPF